MHFLPSGSKRLEVCLLFLESTPDISAITNLINTWIHIGQALVASVGALALISALACSA
jgi:hypothetical protein